MPHERLTESRRGRYASHVKRLELARLRVCERCGRGGAELRGTNGETLVVPLDPVHARQLGGDAADDVHALADVLLAQLRGPELGAREVVLDVAHGRLRALVSLQRGGEPDVVACPAGEGVVLAVRGGFHLYATDEALAHGAARGTRAGRQGGAGGTDTLH
jgi:hypothetical protein